MSRASTSRFFLSRGAANDLAAIRSYLDPVPDRFALPTLRGLRAMLTEIAVHPQRGAGHSEATRLIGQEVKTRVFPPYRIFYKDPHGTPEVLAILHTAQDIATILRERFQ